MRALPRPPIRLFARGHALAFACAVLACGSVWDMRVAHAQAWPAKPVRMIISFGPGSGSDLVGRLIAEELRVALGQTVVVENKPGASAQIAAEYVARATPDGYTIFMSSNTAQSANPFLFRKLNYDPIRDFTGIARVAYVPYVLGVERNSKYQSVRELVDAARANPGKIIYGFGNSTSQVASAAFARQGKAEFTVVGYKSMPPAITDALGGRIDFLFVDLASGQSYLKSGAIRPLAFTLSKRSALMPEIPAVAETPGFEGFDVTSWVGLVGPAGMPRPIVERLAGETQKALAKPELRAKLAAMGSEAAPSTAEEMDSFLREQLESWRRRIADAGIQPE